MSESGTGTPFERISSREGLEDGWRTVLAKDASDGILQKKTKEFAEHLDDFLTELSGSLRSGTYEPDPLLSFGIPKGTSGEVRTLHIPSIRDRVVERAVVNTITHRADLAMSPCSFAYRTGIGTDDAVDHLARLRDAGYRYVLRTDIEDYFPNLNIEDALATLSPITGCPRTIDLIRLIARPRRARGERRTRNRGIAQGSCLSPLLANLALTNLDRAMGDAGYGYARFADDIVICSPHEPDLLEALELLDTLLTPRGLRLNQEKTAMTSFDEGFCYLGTDFSRSFPPVDPRHDIKGRPNPDQVVYVGRDGARVHVSQNRLIVDGADGLPQVSIPRRAVSRIVLTGAVGLSSGARSWALYNNIDVIFLSRHGGYLGQLAGPRSTASARRLLTQASFAINNDARLPLARHRARQDTTPGLRAAPHRPAQPGKRRRDALHHHSAAGRQRRAVPRSVVSRRHAEYAQLTNAPRPATPPVSCATISAAGRGDECCRDGRLSALHDVAVPRCDARAQEPEEISCLRPRTCRPDSSRI